MGFGGTTEMTLRRLIVAMAMAGAVAGASTAAQGAGQAARPAAPAPQTMSKAIALAQGMWVFTHMNGQSVEGSGQEIAVTITENKYVQTANGQVVERGTFKIDDTKKPWTIDISITEGEEAGQTQVGVVQLTGDTMVGKLADAGVTTRPTDFSQSEGAFVFTAVRRKK